MSDHATDAPGGPWPSAAAGDDPDPSESENLHSAVRLCATCGKTAQVLDQSEYTPQRAALILQHGLCVCPSPGGQDSSSAADLLP